MKVKTILIFTKEDTDMESAGKKPDELSNLKEIVYSMKQYAEERTETEILVEQIDKAKEKEGKRPSEFSEKNLGKSSITIAQPFITFLLEKKN